VETGCVPPLAPPTQDVDEVLSFAIGELVATPH
jgi:hypothetical protein